MRAWSCGVRVHVCGTHRQCGWVVRETDRTSEYANAIWTANGTAAWAKPFPIGGTIAGVSSDVTFYNGTVSFGTESGAFFVLDAASGELFDAFSQINANSKIQGAVSVDTATSTLYFTSQGETVYRVSLDLKRRQVQEHIPYSLGSIISTTPVVDVANRGLLVTTHGGLRVSGSLYRIDCRLTCAGSCAHPLPHTSPPLLLDVARQWTLVVSPRSTARQARCTRPLFLRLLLKW